MKKVVNILIFAVSLGLFLTHNQATMKAEAAIQHYLTVKTAGEGFGSVSLSTGSYFYVSGNTSIARLNAGQPVTLTPVPDIRHEFLAWSGGGCTGTGACTVTINSSMTITAYFGLAIPSLSEWGQYLLMALLFVSGVYMFRYRKT